MTTRAYRPNPAGGYVLEDASLPYPVRVDNPFEDVKARYPGHRLAKDGWRLVVEPDVPEEGVDAEIAALEKEMAELRAAIAPFEARLHRLAPRLHALLEIRGRLRAEERAAEISAGKEPDWKALFRRDAAGGGIAMAEHRLLEGLLRERFDMYLSGYWQETCEAAARVKIARNDTESLWKNALGVRTLARVLTPLGDGLVPFGIFEHTLSAGGSFTLHVAPDLSRAEIRNRWKNRGFAGADALDKALAHIAAELWYGGDKGDS